MAGAEHDRHELQADAKFLELDGDAIQALRHRDRELAA